MKLVRKTICCFAFSLVAGRVIADPAPASILKAEAKPEIYTLGIIDGEAEQNLSVVTARFNKALPWEKLELEEHGTFLQVKFDKTIVANSGVFYEGNSPYITKIAAFQIDETTGALRLFVSKDASKMKLAAKVDVLGDRIIVTVDHDKVAQLLLPQEIAAAAPVAQKTETAPETKLENAAAGTTEVKAVETVVKEEAPKIGQNIMKFDLRDKAIIATVFSAVMFALLGAVFFIRRVLRRKGGSSIEKKVEIEPVTMKLLSSLSVAPKQRLSLIQVGDQQILIGVSADSVNYITTVGKKNQLAFAEHLVEAKELASEIPMKANPLPMKSIHAGKPPVPSAPERKPASEAKKKRTEEYEDLSKLIRERLRKLPTT